MHCSSTSSSRLPLALMLLGALALSGCDSKTESTQKAEPAVGLHQATPKEEQASPRQWTPIAPQTAPAPAGAEAAATPQASATIQERARLRAQVAETRKQLEEASGYLRQNRPDLARASLERLKAKREGLPEFLQNYVDQLDAKLRAGISEEPQASIKAAIIASQKVPENDR